MTTRRAVVMLACFALWVPLAVFAQPRVGQTQRRLYAVETFALAFMDGSNRVHVSLSRDGVTWKEAASPGLLAPAPLNSKGVAVCGSVDGRRLFVVMHAGENILILAEGAVSDLSVAWATPVILTVQRALESAPTCSVLPDGLLGVATVSTKTILVDGAMVSTNTMLVYEYPGGDEFIGAAYPSKYNYDIFGRASLVTLNDATIASWQTTASAVILAQAGMVAGPTNKMVFLFDPLATGALLLSNSELEQASQNDPALATDGTSFYVAVVQAEKPHGAGTLSGWRVVLYKSAGNELDSGWAEYARLVLDVSNQAYVNLAVSETGTMVAATCRLAHTVGVLNARVFRNGSWQDLGTAPWVGVSGVPYQQFGLTRIGINAPFHLPQGLKTPPPQRKVGP